MKMKKMCLSLLMVLMMFSECIVCLAADNNTKFLHDSFASAEDELQIYASNVLDEVPEKDAVTVELGSQSVPVTDVSLSDSLPTCYYCLVDLSGSISSAQFQQEQDALKAIAGKMGKQDCMIIGSLGNDVKLTDAMTDKDKITEYIDSLEVSHEDTNLYKGIVDSMDDLLSMDSSMQRCLVLLSDGEDDQKTGITEDEAMTAVKSSHIPVFSVAVLPENPSDEKTEYAKLLGSFARNSAGGVHCAPVLEDSDGKAAGNAIAGRMQNNLVITANIADIRDQAEKKDSLLLSVSVKGSGKTYTDELTVLSSALILSEPETETEPQTEAATEPETEAATEAATEAETESAEPDSGMGSILPIIIIVLVLAAILAFVLLRRKKSDDGDGDSGSKDAEINGGNFDGEDSGNEVTNGAGDNDEGESDITGLAAGGSTIFAKPVPRMIISWITLNNPDIDKVSTSLTPDEWHSFGRDDRSEFILHAGDKKLSGINFYVKWEKNAENRILMYDRNSTNGTFVNGVPIRDQGTVILESGSLVRAGSYEYRMIIEKYNNANQ